MLIKLKLGLARHWEIRLRICRFCCSSAGVGSKLLAKSSHHHCCFIICLGALQLLLKSLFLSALLIARPPSFLISLFAWSLFLFSPHLHRKMPEWQAHRIKTDAVHNFKEGISWHRLRAVEELRIVLVPSDVTSHQFCSNFSWTIVVYFKVAAPDSRLSGKKYPSLLLLRRSAWIAAWIYGGSPCNCVQERRTFYLMP